MARPRHRAAGPVPLRPALRAAPVRRLGEHRRQRPDPQDGGREPLRLDAGAVHPRAAPAVLLHVRRRALHAGRLRRAAGPHPAPAPPAAAGGRRVRSGGHRRGWCRRTPASTPTAWPNASRRRLRPARGHVMRDFGDLIDLLEEGRVDRRRGPDERVVRARAVRDPAGVSCAGCCGCGATSGRSSGAASSRSRPRTRSSTSSTSRPCTTTRSASWSAPFSTASGARSRERAARRSASWCWTS